LTVDKVENPEEAKRFLRSQGFVIPEEAVKAVLDILGDKSGVPLYRCYTPKIAPGGIVQPAICGKGTAYKIKRLWEAGRLRPYTEYAYGHHSRVATEDAAPDGGETGKSSTDQHDIDIDIRTSCEGQNLLTHGHDTMTLPFDIVFSVTNRSSRLIEHLQLDVWFPSGLSWDPMVDDYGPWVSQGVESPPDKSWEWTGLGRYYRESLQREGFMMPNGYLPVVLHPLTVWCRTFSGVVPVPWSVSAPQCEPLSGALLLWLREGVITTEVLKAPIDFQSLGQKCRLFLGPEAYDRAVRTEERQAEEWERFSQNKRPDQE